MTAVSKSLYNSILQYKSSYILELAAVEELDRYLLLTVSLCARNNGPPDEADDSAVRKKQGCGLLVFRSGLCRKDSR